MVGGGRGPEPRRPVETLSPVSTTLCSHLGRVFVSEAWRGARWRRPSLHSRGCDGDCEHRPCPAPVRGEGRAAIRGAVAGGMCPIPRHADNPGWRPCIRSENPRGAPDLAARNRGPALSQQCQTSLPATDSQFRATVWPLSLGLSLARCFRLGRPQWFPAPPFWTCGDLSGQACPLPHFPREPRAKSPSFRPREGCAPSCRWRPP